MRLRGWTICVAFTFAAGVLSGCNGGKTFQGYAAATGGDAHRGQEVMTLHRCGECHTIPGIRDAHGVFGPPLMVFGRRTMIAGNFPNTPAYLVPWIMSPQSMKPKTAMPDLGLSEGQARDVAAYLYTLR